MKLKKYLKVKIINPNSAWYNKTGELWGKGSGYLWQVGFNGIGIYFLPEEFEIIKLCKTLNYHL